MTIVVSRIGLYIIYHEIKNIILSNFKTNGEACGNLLTKSKYCFIIEYLPAMRNIPLFKF